MLFTATGATTVESVATSLLALKASTPVTVSPQISSTGTNMRQPTSQFSKDGSVPMCEKDVLAFMSGHNNGIVLVNGCVGGFKHHQKINQEFHEFLCSNTRFLCAYLITRNDGSPSCKRLLREAAQDIVATWTGMHEQVLFLQYNKSSRMYRSLEVSIYNWQEGGLMDRMQIHLVSFKSKLALASRRATSQYRYGTGILTYPAEFRLMPLTPSDCVAIIKARKGKMLQLEKLSMDGFLAESKSPKKESGGRQLTLPFPDRNGTKDGLPTLVTNSKRFTEWKRSLKEEDKANYRKQYNMLKDVKSHLAENWELTAPRLCWQQVFTRSCLTPCGGRPCLSCRGCRMRFAQATLVLVAAQGMMDTRCLPHFGAVFRHPRYALFSIEEWCAISLEELTMVYSPISKQCISAVYVHYFLINFVMGRSLPKTVAEISCYQGFGKKTACLLLSAMDPQLLVGIPVDRHLAEAFRSLGWAHGQEKNEEMISYMVELWLPRDQWAECNLVCAGLRQLWAIPRVRELMLSIVREEFGEEHINLIAKTCSQEAYSSDT